MMMLTNHGGPVIGTVVVDACSFFPVHTFGVVWLGAGILHLRIGLPSADLGVVICKSHELLYWT